jgi:hypothetical protein
MLSHQPPLLWASMFVSTAGCLWTCPCISAVCVVDSNETKTATKSSWTGTRMRRRRNRPSQWCHTKHQNQPCNWKSSGIRCKQGLAVHKKWLEWVGIGFIGLSCPNFYRGCTSLIPRWQLRLHRILMLAQGTAFPWSHTEVAYKSGSVQTPEGTEKIHSRQEWDKITELTRS